MKAGTARSVRCAIYTRVSTDAGLDQEFNSLDAQHDAAAAYIRSQAHAGWILAKTRYDDGGFSGGSTDRPALQKLLADVKAQKIGVIVVYKVDRLTRSLTDFAKLVELFDAQGVSFVSVTQQFNTTTSMGRLTLNVLLSFAQFEREVTSERIRDKIGASKRKGLWVGGVVPLGYHAKDRKITVVESEARTVRHIFHRYLDLGSLNLLLADLKKSQIKTRARPLASGRRIGGIPFTRGPLAYLLRNRFYVGEVKYKGEVFAGEQPAVLDRALFDAVQTKLEQQRTNHATSRQTSEALLSGLIFDDRGNRMTPTYAIKNGVRYRYYMSTVLVQGEAAKAGAIKRVPAGEIEDLVATAVKRTLSGSPNKPGRNDENSIDLTTDVGSKSNPVLIRRHVLRVDMATGHIKVSFARESIAHDQPRPSKAKQIEVSIPWTKRPSKVPREILFAVKADGKNDIRPIRSETRTKLVTAIAKGRHWLEEIVNTDLLTADKIAVRESCSVRQVNMMISLAFLSPTLVQAAIDGRLPRGIGVATLRDAPAEWALQHQKLGLAD